MQPVRLLGFSILLSMGAFITQPASAEPVNLLCSMNHNPAERETQPTTIQLDEAAHTVTVHFGAYDMTTGPGGSVSGSGGDYTVGPLPGEFTSDSIKFTPPTEHNPAQNYYILNRLTGALNLYSPDGQEWAFSWSCHVANKMF